MTIDEWLRRAVEDAERRRRPALAPHLAALAEATRRLRGAAWNREAAARGRIRHAGPDDDARGSAGNREAAAPAPPTRPPDEP